MRKLITLLTQEESKLKSLQRASSFHQSILDCRPSVDASGHGREQLFIPIAVPVRQAG
jgi:hypothetical protein